MTWEFVASTAVSFVLLWFVAAVVLWRSAPEQATLREVLRIFPDIVRLLRNLSQDETIGRSFRWKLRALFVYLAMPFDLVPDFVPVIGHIDDAIIVWLVLSSIARGVGSTRIRRHWPGSSNGLETLLAFLRVRRSV